MSQKVLFMRYFGVDIGRSFFKSSKITYIILCNLCSLLCVVHYTSSINNFTFLLKTIRTFFWFEASLGYEFRLLNRWPCHPQDPIGGAKEVKSRQIFFSTPTCAEKKLNAWLMTYTTIMNSWPLVQGVIPYVRTNMNI